MNSAKRVPPEQICSHSFVFMSIEKLNKILFGTWNLIFEQKKSCDKYEIEKTGIECLAEQCEPFKNMQCNYFPMQNHEF